VTDDRPRELPAPARRPALTGREQWLGVGVALLLTLLLVSLFLPLGRERVVVAQPAAATVAAQPMQHQDPALLDQLVAARTCVVLANQLVRPAEDLRTSWLQHATAHRLGWEGEISEAEMKRRWKVTLGQQVTQDPVFMRALDAMRTACER
jgi:hypothetical protein